MDLLQAVIQETAPTPDCAVIWLHGLGANGYDFAPIVPELQLPKSLAIRFIFPHAPSIPVTVNGGMVMPAWYDILDMAIDRRVDTEQLSRSADNITALIDNECVKGIASERIVVAGFSQGGAVAYEATLRFPRPLGGLLAMSTYFATEGSIVHHEANAAIPIEIHHGEADPVVPEHLGKRASETLKKRGYNTTYRTYPMEHGVCAQQIADIGSWLRNLLIR